MRVPNAMNIVVAATEVNIIITAQVADATSGCTPICSIKGPFTMPPPTPNIPETCTKKKFIFKKKENSTFFSCEPAKNPAKKQMHG